MIVVMFVFHELNESHTYCAAGWYFEFHKLVMLFNASTMPSTFRAVVTTAEKLNAT